MVLFEKKDNCLCLQRWLVCCPLLCFQCWVFWWVNLSNCFIVWKKFKCEQKSIDNFDQWKLRILQKWCHLIKAQTLHSLQSSNETCEAYMSEENMSFICELIMALTVQHCNLHKRLALKIISVIGCSQRKWMHYYGNHRCNWSIIEISVVHILGWILVWLWSQCSFRCGFPTQYL